MQVATGKSVMNGIAIGKIKVYRAPDLEIRNELSEDPEGELEKFERAREKAIEQQNLLYEKAVVDAGEDSAEVFSVHAMMLEDDDLLDATKEIILKQKHCAEYAVKVAFDNQAKVFSEMEDPYMKERAADIYDIEQAVLNILFGVDPESMQGKEPAILAARDLTPSETVRLDKSLASSQSRALSTVIPRSSPAPWGFPPSCSAMRLRRTGTGRKPLSTDTIPVPISSRLRIFGRR